MNDRELMQQALEALDGLSEPYDVLRIQTALRERLAQQEQEPWEQFYPDMGDPMRQEPVAHSIVAGALFDFMGWLTSRKERLILSSVDEASPAVEVIKQFAVMRDLSLDDAKVQEWQTLLAPQRREWVGLTEDEAVQVAIDCGCLDVAWLVFARAIEAKLKERNT